MVSQELELTLATGRFTKEKRELNVAVSRQRRTPVTSTKNQNDDEGKNIREGGDKGRGEKIVTSKGRKSRFVEHL